MFSYSALCWWKSRAGIPPRHGFTGTQPRAVQCPAQTRRLLHCGNLHMRESERPHQHQGAACLPPLFSRICSVQLPREWRCCHSVSVSRGVAPCHESRDSPSHLINWSAAVYTTRHTAPHCHQLATQSHFTWETPGRAKLSPPPRQWSSEVPSLNWISDGSGHRAGLAFHCPNLRGAGHWLKIILRRFSPKWRGYDQDGWRV